MITLIDLEDLQKILDFEYSWSPRLNHNNQKYYAHTTIHLKELQEKYKRRGMTLHSFILNTEPNVEIDHKNHDTLDNRKSNLRVISDGDNSSNREGANKNNKTGVRNVCKLDYCYLVQIMKKGIRYKWEFSLDKFEEACKFAKEKRKELFGEFAGNS